MPAVLLVDGPKEDRPEEEVAASREARHSTEAPPTVVSAAPTPMLFSPQGTHVVDKEIVDTGLTLAELVEPGSILKQIKTKKIQSSPVKYFVAQ